MEKLRIAVWHNLPSGGGKRQLYYHVQGLVERGHYLEAWCPNSADQNYLSLSGIIKEHVLPLEVCKGSDHFPRSVNTVRALARAIEENAQRCAEQINRGGFDVLHANPCIYFRTTPIARYVHLPSVLTLHEPFRELYEALPELPWIAPPMAAQRPFLSRTSWQCLGDTVTERLALEGLRLQARKELEYAHTFDVLLSNSRFSRESILRAYNIESKICYLGIDTDLFRPTGEAKEYFVLGLGTISLAKGVDRAIRAIAAVRKEKRPPIVWISNASNENHLISFRALAQRLDVEFIHRDNIPDNDVVSLLSRAMAMIYTPRLEPFGLAPLEANACGTPVVAIAEGGVRESVQDGINGFLAPDDDPEMLGGLISRFLDDPSLSYSMGLQGMEYVQYHWNMKSCIDNIESHLLRVSTIPKKVSAL